jgi:hypothetical protein
VGVDRIEQMFEYGHMSPALTLEGAPPRRPDVLALQQRIHSMEAVSADHQLFPVGPGLESLFPEGGLQRGSIYQVDSSASLLWSLIAEATTKGTWCALVGIPDAGLAAAAELGVNVDRLVLVPYPDTQWLSVVGALIDVVGIVALGSVAAPSDRMLSTLSGRLREREATLLVRQAWPRCESSIHVRHQWSGVKEGGGLLHEHLVHIEATPRHGQPVRRADLMIDAWGAHDVGRHAPVIDIATQRQVG